MLSLILLDLLSAHLYLDQRVAQGTQNKDVNMASTSPIFEDSTSDIGCSQAQVMFEIKNTSILIWSTEATYQTWTSQRLPKSCGEKRINFAGLTGTSSCGRNVQISSMYSFNLTQMALKLADLGHLSAPLAVHLRWVDALEEEFFRQGEKEKACNMPISPLFDRTKPGITKSQVGGLWLCLLMSWTAGIKKPFMSMYGKVLVWDFECVYWSSRLSPSSKVTVYHFKLGMEQIGLKWHMRLGALCSVDASMITVGVAQPLREPYQ